MRKDWFEYRKIFGSPLITLISQIYLFEFLRHLRETRKVNIVSG